MTLLTHVLTGVCAGCVAAPILEKKFSIRSGTSVFLVGLGAFLPDMDGITILFSHKTYYGTAWYSHHGAMHSLSGIALIALAIAALSLGVRRLSGKKADTRRFVQESLLIYFGSIIHLLGDLPTPPGHWLGLKLFWPFSDRIFGGWSRVWWINYYLIFFLSQIFTISLVLLGMNHFLRRGRLRSSLMILLVLINLAALGETVRYILTSHYLDRTQWSAYQHQLLGSSICNRFARISKKVFILWQKEIL